jgi:hypothetical protein
MRLLKSTRFINVSVNSQVKETMAITPRQCEVLYRLSEASVRARLADKVTVNDALLRVDTNARQRNLSEGGRCAEDYT